MDKGQLNNNWCIGKKLIKDCRRVQDMVMCSQVAGKIDSHSSGLLKILLRCFKRLKLLTISSVRYLITVFYVDSFSRNIQKLWSIWTVYQICFVASLGIGLSSIRYVIFLIFNQLPLLAEAHKVNNKRSSANSCQLETGDKYILLLHCSCVILHFSKIIG